MKRLCLSVFIAAVLWFVMFSPWTARYVNFWYMMTASAVILISLSVTSRPLFLSVHGLDGLYQRRRDLTKAFLYGIGIAVVLWLVFWIGDKLSQMMFQFARPQVDTIYGMKGDTSKWYICVSLLMLIGPAEEIFWRGYVQRRLMDVMGKNWGLIVATLIYTLIHIWSFNFMLVMAAMVVGMAWGWLYRLDRRLLLPLIISHALWDAAAFVIFPF